MIVRASILDMSSGGRFCSKNAGAMLGRGTVTASGGGITLPLLELRDSEAFAFARRSFLDVVVSD